MCRVGYSSLEFTGRGFQAVHTFLFQCPQKSLFTSVDYTAYTQSSVHHVHHRFIHQINQANGRERIVAASSATSREMTFVPRDNRRCPCVARLTTNGGEG